MADVARGSETAGAPPNWTFELGHTEAGFERE